MRRIAIFLLLAGSALAAPAGFVIERLPWMTDTMKGPCGKTAFEYNLAAGQVNPEPFQLCVFFDAMRFVGTPTTRGLVVRCDVRPRTGVTMDPASKNWGNYISNGLQHECEMARRRF